MRIYLEYWWRMFQYIFKGGRMYYLWLGFLFFLIGWGGVCYYHQLDQGLIVTHMSDQVSWGLGIANFVYFVGVAASAVILIYPAYVNHDQNMKDVVILGEQLAFTAIMMCLIFIFTDIGRPERFLHLIPFLGGRLNLPSSLLAWDVIVFNIYLLLNLHIPGYLLYMKYLGRKPSWFLYLPLVFVSFFFAISIHTVTAFLLSGLGSRYFWNTAIMAPRFLVSAFSVGPAILYLIFLAANHFTKLNVKASVFEYLQNVLRFTLPVNLFLLLCEVFKELYPGTHHAASSHYLYFGLKGHYLLTWFIWPATIMNIIAAFIVSVKRLRNNQILFIIACHLCIVGLWLEKGMGLIIPGFIPTPLGEISEYYPNLDEIVLSLAITALGALMFTFFAKVTIAIMTGELRYEMKPKAAATLPLLILFVSLLAGPIVFPASVSAKEKSIVSGSVMQDYRLQTTGGFTDNLIETLITLNFGDPSIHRFSGSIQGGVIGDFNKQAPTSPLFSIYDTFGSHAIGRFYYGYLDVNRVSLFDNIRVGRQHLYDMVGLQFDGVSVESKAYAGFVLSAFAGVPVHLYESMYGIDPGDWTVGGALQWSPIARLRFRVSAVSLRDQFSGFRLYLNNRQDTLLGAAFWLNITPNWEIYSRVTAFTDQIRDLDFSSSTRFPKYDLKFTVTVHRLFEAYGFRVDELDPFSFAGLYQPYTEIMAQVYKGFGKKFSLAVGGGKRILDQYQFASTFNHGFDKVYGSFSTRDFPFKGLSTTTTADYYRGDDNILKNNYFGMSFSLSQEFLKKRLVVGGGTAYYLYRFNQFTGNESSNVQTYFAQIEGRVRKDLKLKANYEFEDNPVNGFHSGRVRAIWDF